MNMLICREDAAVWWLVSCVDWRGATTLPYGRPFFWLPVSFASYVNKEGFGLASLQPSFPDVDVHQGYARASWGSSRHLYAMRSPPPHQSPWSEHSSSEELCGARMDGCSGFTTRLYAPLSAVIWVKTSPCSVNGHTLCNGHRHLLTLQTNSGTMYLG